MENVEELEKEMETFDIVEELGEIEDCEDEDPGEKLISDSGMRTALISLGHSYVELGVGCISCLIASQLWQLHLFLFYFCIQSRSSWRSENIVRIRK